MYEMTVCSAENVKGTNDRPDSVSALKTSSPTLGTTFVLTDFALFGDTPCVCLVSETNSHLFAAFHVCPL